MSSLLVLFVPDHWKMALGLQMICLKSYYLTFFYSEALWVKLLQLPVSYSSEIYVPMCIPMKLTGHFSQTQYQVSRQASEAAQMKIERKDWEGGREEAAGDVCKYEGPSHLQYPLGCSKFEVTDYIM